MKYTKRTIAAVLVIVLVLILLTGCGKISPAGKYYIKSIDGIPIEEFVDSRLKETGASLESFLKECNINSVEEYIIFEFKSDGTAIKYFPGLDPVTYSWKQNGDKIIISEGDQSAECTFNEKEFSFNGGGTEYKFIKK